MGGTSYRFVIPNSVTSIGDGAFYGCSSLTSVNIGNSVTSIGNSPFFRCSSLTSIFVDSGNPNYDSRDNCNAIIETATNTLIAGCMNTIIPNSVTSIGNSAFYGCSSLTSIDIPNSVTSIGNSAFHYCSSLTSITIPNSVTSIGNWAFNGCSGLTSVNIGNSVTSIGKWAFDGCSSLTSITIPNSVTSIGDGAFYGCSSLTSVTIPNSVTSIGNSAFYGCSSLTSVNIGNSVTSIGNRAFNYCSSLTSIFVDSGNPNYDSRDNCNAIIETATNTLIAGCMNTIIPNSVTSIGNGAFSSIYDLTSIDIPNSVTSIGNSAFSGCSSLTSITIPNSVTSIGNEAFSGTAWFNNQPDGLVYAGLVAYKYKGTMPTGASITIADGTLGIAGGAFSWCCDLTSITIPNSVTSIGAGALSGCYGLASIDIPNSVTSIGDQAFYGSGLTSINIPNSVTSIGIEAFSSIYDLTSVTIPNSVTSIGDQAFYSCSSLNEIYSYIVDLSSIAMGDGVFYRVPANNDQRTLYVPAGTSSAYQADAKWSDYFGSIVETESVLVSSIELNESSAEMAEGNALQLIATLLPANATDKTVTWASSDEAVAAVDGNGLVTAVAAGTATITATTNDGSNLSASCTITVTKAEIEVFEFHIDDMEAEAGSTITIPVLLHNDGVIQGFEFDLYYSEGFAITSYTKTSRLLESNIIRITGYPSNHYYHIAGVKTSLPMILVEAGDGAILNLNLKVPDNASGNYVFWLKNIEIVNANNEGIEQSNTNATFTIHEKSPVLATSIQLDETTATMTENETLQLTATVLPDDATDKTVNWATSDESVATVDRNGLVTAVAPGTATITATTIDGSNLSATCVVTVSVPASANNTLGADAMVIYRGEEKQLAVRMDNDSLITAVQCDIYLPEGISIATEEGDYLIDITPERASSNHVISTNDLPNGAIRLFITSATSKPFKGNSGDLFILNIIAGEDAATGEYGIDLRNVILSDTEAHPYYAPDVTVPVSIRDYIKGDVNIDNTVNVSDYVATANYILELDPHPFLFIAADIDENNTINVSDLVGVANIALNFMGVPAIQHAPAVGEGVMNMAANCMMTAPGRYVVTLDLNNSNAITAFQMDVNLPAGMRLAGAWLSDRASSSHSLEMTEPAGGAYRMLGASMMSKAFAGNEGALLTMEIEGTADGMAIIDGIMLAEPNTTLHQHHALTLSFAPSGVSELTDGLRIYTQGDMIVVESPVATQVQFVLPNGMNIVRDVKAGRNVYNTGLKGIVIVKAGNQVKKFNL